MAGVEPVPSCMGCRKQKAKTDVYFGHRRVGQREMKVAVTGANGFLGRYVVKELERLNISPILVMRPTTEVPTSLSHHLVVPIDIQSPPDNIYSLMHEPDVLIHLAWGGLPNYHSSCHLEKELPAHFRFIESAVSSGLENVTVSGTCFEYGMQSGELSPNLIAQPVTAYGEAKASLHLQLNKLQSEFNFSLRWARLFYLCGFGQGKNAILPTLEAAVKNGDEVFNMSGGEQLRDSLPVEEATAGLVSMALETGRTEVRNICSGKPISIRKLVENKISEEGWKIELNLGHYPYPTYEPMEFWGKL